MLRLIVLALCLVPTLAHAAVTVSEIAWMGTSASANNEWIELHNDGAAVDVSGWTLSDGVNLTIELSGTIGSGAYAVLERTDDSSAPGTAFLIYTGALTNTGGTLTLYRADGSIADQVSGGEDWQNIGGDNTTKETAQYTTKGWVTGTPTPGSANVTAGSASAPEEEVVATAHQEDDSDSDDAGGGDVFYISLTRPDSELVLAIDGPERAFVNQPLTLTVTPRGLGPRLLDSLRYEWNFGDLTTSTGKQPEHAYTHPGTYIVVVRAWYGDHEAYARHTVTVMPQQLSLSLGPSDTVQVHNDAPYEADLSGYRLVGGKTYEFPPLTFLTPRSTLTLDMPAAEGAMLALYDAKGAMVETSLPARLLAEAEVSEPAPPAAAPATRAAAPTPATLSFAPPPTEPVPMPPPQISATSTSRVLAAAPAAAAAAPGAAAVPLAGGIPQDKLPYLGLMGILALGILALYTRTPRAREPQPFDFQ